MRYLPRHQVKPMFSSAVFSSLCQSALLALLLLAAQTRSEPLRTGPDERTPVNPHARGKEFLKPIGLLIDRNSKKSATGVLISSCHVLTNRHTVGGVRAFAREGQTEYEEDLTIDVVGNVLEFQIGYDDAGQPSELRSVTKATVVATGKGGDVDDWAVLRLSRPLGKIYGVAPLRGVPFLPGQVLVTAGYPADKLYIRGDDGRLARNVRLWEQHGTLQEERAYWTADLRALAGQSGSPVFVKNDDGYAVIALLRAEFPPNQRTRRSTAQLVPLTYAIERLSAVIEEYPCTKR